MANRRQTSGGALQTLTLATAVTRTLTVMVRVEKTGYRDAGLNRTLVVDLEAPTAPGYTAPGSLRVRKPVTVSPSGGSGIDTYSASGLPAGLCIDSKTGVISGMPRTENANTVTVTVTVKDAAGIAATVELVLPRSMR